MQMKTNRTEVISALLGNEFSPEFVDAHCHLDKLDNPRAYVQEAGVAGYAFFAMTCEPSAFEPLQNTLVNCENVTVGLGLHPWYVGEGTDEGAGISSCEAYATQAGAHVGESPATQAGVHVGESFATQAGERVGESFATQAGEHVCETSGKYTLEEQLAQFESLLDKTQLVGEVGLDFSPKHNKTREAQIEAFTRIASLCANRTGKILSLHAVDASTEVLDILEETGCLDACTCIFHWFSGSSEDLIRARDAGCLFSMGRQMLASRRGSSYILAVDWDHILIETDYYPEGDAQVFEHVHQMQVSVELSKRMKHA